MIPFAKSKKAKLIMKRLTRLSVNRLFIQHGVKDSDQNLQHLLNAIDQDKQALKDHLVNYQSKFTEQWKQKFHASINSQAEQR